jgi:hypothetical protein
MKKGYFLEISEIVRYSAKKINNYLTKDLSLRRNILKHRYTHRIKSLKERNMGERCFLIGNGPSLDPKDLDKIAGEQAFAFNRIFYIFDKTIWRPTIYMIQDLRVIEDCTEKFEFLSSICNFLFINNMAYRYCNTDVKQKNNVLFFHIARTHSTSRRFFSEDISKIICAGSNIVFSAMQTAVYMGFKEIYLLGMDHTMSIETTKKGCLSGDDVTKSYFKGTPDHIKVSGTDKNEITRSFIIAKHYADEHGINIFNATRGGALEVFDRVDLDTIKI